MELTNYKFDYYVGTNVVKTGDVGTAKYTFEGIPAFYDLVIGYIDEDDGNCSYSVNVAGKEIADWTADKNPTKDCLFTKTLEGIELSSNSEIKILGTRNKGESARLAHIEIVYSHGMNLFSLLKYSFGHFAQNIYTANFFIILATLLAFLVLNITAFTLLKPKKRTPALTEFVKKPEDFQQSNVQAESRQNIVQEEVLNYAYISVECRPDSLIDKMTKYIESNYTDSNFSVQQMADHFNLSLNYISSFFKEQTGQNIVYYLTNLRVDKAKALLSSSDLPIKSVAESSGYYNVSSFIRRFKQITGHTPGEYRLNRP